MSPNAQNNDKRLEQPCLSVLTPFVLWFLTSLNMLVTSSQFADNFSNLLVTFSNTGKLQSYSRVLQIYVSLVSKP